MMLITLLISLPGLCHIHFWEMPCLLALLDSDVGHAWSVRGGDFLAVSTQLSLIDERLIIEISPTDLIFVYCESQAYNKPEVLIPDPCCAQASGRHFDCDENHDQPLFYQFRIASTSKQFSLTASLNFFHQSLH